MGKVLFGGVSAVSLVVLIGVCAGAPPPPRDPAEAAIAWHGTWQAGLAEAQRTKRPIFLMSGAPQCRGVPGAW